MNFENYTDRARGFIQSEEKSLSAIARIWGEKLDNSFAAS